MTADEMLRRIRKLVRPYDKGPRFSPWLKRPNSATFTFRWFGVRMRACADTGLVEAIDPECTRDRALGHLITNALAHWKEDEE